MIAEGNEKTSMPKRPNVIWVLADQLRAQALSCNGETNICTPNLDQLAARGVNYQAAVSGYPLCCPYRGSMLTGQYPHHCTPGHDMGLPPEKQTIAHVLREAGYHTAYFGKWHLDAEGAAASIRPNREVMHIVRPENRGGFDRWVGYENNNEPWDCYVHGDGTPFKRLEGFETDALTDLLIDYMAEPHDKPFFAVLSVFPPHNPYLAPERFAEGLTPESIRLRPNVPPVPWVEQQARRELAGYYAMVRNLDWNVGRIVDALDTLRLADDTYIVFFSDHGDMHGSHGWFRKTNPYEESCRIPFIISTGHGCMYSVAPELLYGANGAALCDAPLNHVDVAPTTLGLCSVPTPEWMEGYDYSGYVTGRTLPEGEPDSAFLQCNTVTGHLNSTADPWRGIITRDGWKYVVTEHGPWMLYNLKDDPYEQMNMAHITNYRAIMSDLNLRLARWLERTGDKFPLPDIHCGVIRRGRGNGVYHGAGGRMEY
ncbi:Sulfatase [uncultured Eubacteriales bacterium]|uniref:Sulfatase n=1 Tax=uncultured Eubacteriales bacterium TaxID=172733 RepID=A0A212JRN9_9FIRM|nr:Sulfatase [uncultured Eubacteriales bacterium]